MKLYYYLKKIALDCRDSTNPLFDIKFSKLYS